MISKQPHGISPTLRVTINGSAVDYFSINEIEMHLEEGLHDMLVMRLAGIPPRAMSDYRNSPVYCSMDLGAGMTADFYGYVIDVRSTAQSSGGLLNGSPFQDATLYCLGTSYEMRGGTSRVWKDQRLQDVVATMSETYGFSADVPTDVLVLSPMLQDNESDWQFLTRYASTLGYATTMHGTHLHVFDPYSAFSRRISYNRLYTVKQMKASMSTYPGQISSFDVSMAQHHADGVYKDTTIFVHQDDNTIYEVSLRDIRGITAPARFSNRLRDSVDTYEQAKRAIEVESKSTYDYSATAMVVGLPGCKPGGVVEVDSYGAANVDGLWYVKAVTHRLHSNAFTSELKLVRNINSELNPNSVHAMQPPPAPKLTNGRWAAIKRTLNAYA